MSYEKRPELNSRKKTEKNYADFGIAIGDDMKNDVDEKTKEEAEKEVSILELTEEDFMDNTKDKGDVLTEGSPVLTKTHEDRLEEIKKKKEEKEFIEVKDTGLDDENPFSLSE